MTSAVSWFEIPTADFQRAIDFYNAAFGLSLVGVDAGRLNWRLFQPKEVPVGRWCITRTMYQASTAARFI